MSIKHTLKFTFSPGSDKTFKVIEHFNFSVTSFSIWINMSPRTLSFFHSRQCSINYIFKLEHLLFPIFLSLAVDTHLENHLVIFILPASHVHDLPSPQRLLNLIIEMLSHDVRPCAGHCCLQSPGHSSAVIISLNSV